ncbi:MAG: hypothetical protein ACRCX2_13180 [Paraclostridium sp.]
MKNIKKELFQDVLDYYGIKLDTYYLDGEIKIYKKGKRYYATILSFKIEYDEPMDAIHITSREVDLKTRTLGFTSYGRVDTIQNEIKSIGKSVDKMRNLYKYRCLDNFINKVYTDWKDYSKSNELDYNIKPRIVRNQINNKKLGEFITTDHVLMYSKDAAEEDFFLKGFDVPVTSKDTVNEEGMTQEEKEAIYKVLLSGNPNAVSALYDAVLTKGQEEE